MSKAPNSPSDSPSANHSAPPLTSGELIRTLEQTLAETLVETPIELNPPKIAEPPKSAGGMSAIVSAMKHSLKEMSPFDAASSLLKVNQVGGFDCPGCAWPDPDDRRSMVEFCENGAKAIAEEATRKRLEPAYFSQHSISEISRLSDFEIGHLGRITHPMFKPHGASHYQTISWEEAFAFIAKELNALESPHQATFYTSGRTSNEAAFLYQLFVRMYGTNNLPDCSNMCHESSGTALNEVIGVGKGTVTLEDFDHADLILIIGQNPGTNHPRMLTTLQKAVRNGCKVVSINPLNEVGITAFKHPQEVHRLLGSGTPLASLFVQVRINGDVALLQGVAKELLAAEDENPGTVLNHEFIRHKTSGFTAYVDHLRTVSWEQITEQSGIDREKIYELASLVMKSKRMIICWAMGLTQHKNAVSNIQEIVNLLLLGGHIGRPGAGACPVRGHSNVQGDRTMGIFERMPEWFLNSLGREFSFQAPRAHGLDTVQSLKAMHDEQVKVFIGMGGNFLSATPDTGYTAKALSKCRLTVQISTKLNRSHLVTGEMALILPCLGRTEIDMQSTGPQIVSCENSMGVVQVSKGHLRPCSEHLKSEVAIVAGIALATFQNQPDVLAKAKWRDLANDYSLIRQHISRVIPGFENYNSDLLKAEGFYLPNGARKQEFATSTTKAQFTVHQITNRRLANGHFLLMTIRSHDQFNTTIYGLNDRYRGITNGRRVILMNPDDIQEAGFHAGSAVDIVSHFGQSQRRATHFIIVPYDIPRRCTATYFPEANVLVPIESVADRSNTPTYKSIEVTLERSIGEEK